VSKPSGGPTALIVDDDLGFVCWLSERFNEAGYRSVPALNSRQAGSIVKELNLKITVVVVNPRLPGIPKLIKNLNDVDRSSLKVIVIRDSTVSTPVLFRVDETLERASGWEAPSRHEWLRKLRMIL
jgi:DNA-binding NtrC family response regulator